MLAVAVMGAVRCAGLAVVAGSVGPVVAAAAERPGVAAAVVAAAVAAAVVAAAVAAAQLAVEPGERDEWLRVSLQAACAAQQ